MTFPVPEMMAAIPGFLLVTLNIFWKNGRASIVETLGVITPLTRYVCIFDKLNHFTEISATKIAF